MNDNRTATDIACINLKFFDVLSILFIHDLLGQYYCHFTLMRTALLIFIAWLSVISTSCNSKKASDESAKPLDPKLSSLQQEIFDVHCSAPSCHGSGVKGGLSLVGANSYHQLVGVPSTTNRINTPPLFRVKSGSPDSSLLYIKITSPDSTQGELMPKGSDKLTPDEIETVRQWIMSGAPNN
jgi:mono/diheme cytochrome c family protein